MKAGAAAVALIALLAAATLGSASAQPSPSRVIDRTFRCLTELQAGERTLTVRAQAGVREYGSRTVWKSLAHTSIHNGNLYDSDFIGAGAGRPQPADPSTGTWVDPTRCRSAAPRFAFSPGGLAGGRAGQLGDEYDCAAPRVVLLRLRVELAAPGRLQRDRFGNLSSGAPVRSATLAARTESGRPIALTSVAESGEARILVARSCVAA